MTDTPQVRIVVPNDGGVGSGAGSKVFINGVEFDNLQKVRFKSGVEAEAMRVSTIKLTFLGDIIIERGA